MNVILRTKKDRPYYYVVVRYEDELGKEHQKWITTDISVKGNHKRQAEAKRAEIEAEYKANRLDVGKDAYFIDFMTQWLENLIKGRKIAASTYDAYTLTLNNHLIPYFKPLQLKVKDIEPKHIQRYVNQKCERLSPNTVKKHVVNISSCLESAVRQNIIAFNPARRIEEIKKVKYTGAKHLNEEQIERLLTASVDDPLEIVILLTLFYGLRRSEVLGLKWGAVNLIDNTITIKHTVVRVSKTIHIGDRTKNDSSYSVLPLPGRLKTHLLAWKEKQTRWKSLQPNDYIDSDYICTNFNGALLKPDYPSHHLKRLLIKTELPLIRFHDLRHSSAGFLKHLGFDLKDIQVWLRHSDIQTTGNIYLDLDMEAKQEIANKLEARMVKLKNAF
jgi:integrase